MLPAGDCCFSGPLPAVLHRIPYSHKLFDRDIVGKGELNIRRITGVVFIHFETLLVGKNVGWITRIALVELAVPDREDHIGRIRWRPSIDFPIPDGEQEITAVGGIVLVHFVVVNSAEDVGGVWGIAFIHFIILQVAYHIAAVGGVSFIHFHLGETADKSPTEAYGQQGSLIVFFHDSRTCILLCKSS